MISLASSLTKQDPLLLEPMHADRGKIIIDGNAAAALGAMFAGVTVCDLVSHYAFFLSGRKLIDFMKKHRVEPDGKASFAIVQAEDELAAVGMVLGAGWAGARSMTSTSGPGISLMAEFAGLGYFAETSRSHLRISSASVLSTGMPTRNQCRETCSPSPICPTANTKHGHAAPRFCQRVLPVRHGGL